MKIFFIFISGLHTIAFFLNFMLAPILGSPSIIPLQNRSETVIAFGSCSNYKQEKDPQIFNRIIEKNPDLWMWIGDVAYLRQWEKNENKTLLEFQQAKYAPNYVKLRTKMPVIGIWDDHDFGQNNGDKYYPYKHRIRKLYLDFLDEPQNSIRRTRADGMYHSYYLGDDKRIKVILLDQRFNRDARISINPKADVLGEEQWEWFEQELGNNNAEITLVVSGTQVIVDDRFYPEHWYSYSQNRLYETIRKLKKSGVILLSGDVHYAEIMKHPCPSRIGYNLYEFTSSGLTHYMSGYNLPYGGELVNAIAPYTFNKPEDRFLYKNFGIIRVNKNGPLNISFEIYNEEGNMVLNRFIPYSELKFNQSLIDLSKECILDENNLLRIIKSYLFGMKNGDKILWGFTLLGGIGGLFALFMLIVIYRFSVKKFSPKLKSD